MKQLFDFFPESKLNYYVAKKSMDYSEGEFHI
jgi:hypothetical protein